MILMHFIFSLIWRFAYSVCASLEGKACCAGTYWNNQISSCEKCPLGHHSINCSETCEYPSYGEDCQRACKCGPRMCDYKYGCKSHSSLIIYITKQSHSATLSTKPERTPISTESTPLKEIPSAIPHFFYTILYIAIAFVGIIVMLCGVFVGTYFYKHCLRKVYIPERNKKDDNQNATVGYSGLGVDINQQVEQSRDQTYLEPIPGQNAQYDEIIENNEIDELFEKAQSTTKRKEIDQLNVLCSFPHSKSFSLPLIVNNTTGQSKRPPFSSNSL